jgi:hypothetical protein
MTERKAGLGWRPDKPDYRDVPYRFNRALAGEMQPITMLPPNAAPQRREVDKHGVLDQGQTGSCTGHGTGLCAAVERNVKARSPFFIYYEARRIINETDVDNGAYIRDAVKVCSSLGAPVYSKWPTDERLLFLDPSPSADKDAAKRKVFTYHRLRGINSGQEFRSCLAGGHLFAIGITCFANMFDPSVDATGIVPMPSGGDEGGHCIAIIGYDDDFQHSQWAAEARSSGVPDSAIPERVYEFQNSWGASWGRNGRGVIPADFIEDEYLADDAWTLRGFEDESK